MKCITKVLYPYYDYRSFDEYLLQCRQLYPKNSRFSSHYAKNIKAPKSRYLFPINLTGLRTTDCWRPTVSNLIPSQGTKSCFSRSKIADS